MENDLQKCIEYLENQVEIKYNDSITRMDELNKIIESNKALNLLHKLKTYKGKYSLKYPVGTKVLIHPRKQQEYYEYIQSKPEKDRNCFLREAEYYNMMSHDYFPFEIEAKGDFGYILCDINYGVNKEFKETDLMNEDEYKEYFSKYDLWIGSFIDTTEHYINAEIVSLYREDKDTAKVKIEYLNNGIRDIKYEELCLE